MVYRIKNKLIVPLYTKQDILALPFWHHRFGGGN